MDLLRNVPDELICHILSFLTTKEAAMTSVLSKRWRNLLAFVSTLHIDDSIFLHPEEGKRDRNEIRQSFLDFVGRILALQGNCPVKKVSIKFLFKLDSDRVDGWISNVLARGVSELDLSIDLCMDEYFLLSSKRFESKNLVRLKLHRLCIGQREKPVGWLAGEIFLPMLKTLELDYVGFYGDLLFLRALPALEELVIVDAFWFTTFTDVTVSNPSLKTLTMSSNIYSGSISFDTPSLVYFSHFKYVAKDYPLVNMENLLEARINLGVTEGQIRRAREPNNNDEVVLRFPNVGKLMNGIRNVQCLDLSANTLEMLSLSCESMPVFKNLKSLSIKSAENRGWQAMPVLLRNCPHLETLVLEGLLHFVTDTCGDACDCVSREEKGRSLTSCPVKTLEIKEFHGKMEEMYMITHFLDYFPCLKELKIYIEGNDHTQREVSEVIAEKIKLYNKSSSCNVQLMVSGYHA
ncbi:F-box/LRR-repeat protein [Arabidopsis thaliana]